MADIVKIVIGSCSGYCSVEYAYEDTLTICGDSIRYECRPVIENGAVRAAKWSYRTNSCVFRELFAAVCAAAGPVMDREEDVWLTDVGETTVAVTYGDKKKNRRTFWLPGDDFREFASLVRRMVPPCEEVPIVIMTDEDRENEG